MYLYHISYVVETVSGQRFASSFLLMHDEISSEDDLQFIDETIEKEANNNNFAIINVSLVSSNFKG